jgi:excisionase family DNA binding protein
MQNIILLQLNENELRQLIKTTFNESLSELDYKQSYDPGKLLSIKEASLFLNLAQQTLYGFTSQNKIPFIKKGKKLYFNKMDLENWLKDGYDTTSDEISSTKKLKGGGNE